MYQLLVGEFNISPTDYWRMTPAEVNAIIDSKRPRVIDGIHEDDYESLMLRRQQLIDDGVDVL